MFRVSFFCTEKDLGEAFKRLTGIAKNLEHHYVPNVESKPNGRVYQTAADTIEMLTKELHKRKLIEIKGPEFKTLLGTLGMSTTSYSHYLGGLIQAGILKKGKKVRNTMTYIVTGK